MRAAAFEMPRNLRINAVSPPVGEGDDGEIGHGPAPRPMLRRKAYVAAVEGSHQRVILDLANSEISRRQLCVYEVRGKREAYFDRAIAVARQREWQGGQPAVDGGGVMKRIILAALFTCLAGAIVR